MCCFGGNGYQGDGVKEVVDEVFYRILEAFSEGRPYGPVLIRNVAWCTHSA